VANYANPPEVGCGSICGCSRVAILMAGLPQSTNI
jgi:hypothetical protein